MLAQHLAEATVEQLGVVLKVIRLARWLAAAR
jgi:hypothetical protein